MVTWLVWPCRCARPIAWDSIAWACFFCPTDRIWYRKWHVTAVSTYNSNNTYYPHNAHIPIRMMCVASMRFVPDAAFCKLSIITLIALSVALKDFSALLRLITLLKTRQREISTWESRRVHKKWYMRDACVRVRERWEAPRVTSSIPFYKSTVYIVFPQNILQSFQNIVELNNYQRCQCVYVLYGCILCNIYVCCVWPTCENMITLASGFPAHIFFK